MFSVKKLFSGKFYKADVVTLVLTALLTAIMSEIKVVPLNDEAFRFGLGSVTFLLLILIRPPVSLLRAGFITGLTVVGYRLLGDMVFDTIHFSTSLKNHFPTFFFYFVFGFGLSIIKIEKYKMLPLFLGAWAAGLDFIGNSAEHFIRYLLSDHATFGMREWTLLLGVALLRSYFSVGLYSAIIVSEQKKRMQEMLEVGSELYAETQYLQKSMNHIEQITASSHDLYRTLKSKDLKELSMQALLIAQEIHEVKKDSQRILSGLTKITVQKQDGHYFLSDVLNFVVTANEKYSELLKKGITFRLSSTIDFETDRQIPLLALLNNLAANAVESIANRGEIVLTVYEELEKVHFIIKDSGEGIPEEDLAVIFEPGYTTKFSDHGASATGIGLSHVQEIIHDFEGQIQVGSSSKGTTFQIQIPSQNIRK